MTQNPLKSSARYSLNNLMLNPLTFVGIALILFLICKFFLHLLLGKSHQGQRKKILNLKLYPSSLISFTKQYINDWKTWRNTQINSSKCLPLLQMQDKKIGKKRSKTVSFICHKNEEVHFSIDSSPRRLSKSLIIQEQPIYLDDSPTKKTQNTEISFKI